MDGSFHEPLTLKCTSRIESLIPSLETNPVQGHLRMSGDVPELGSKMGTVLEILKYSLNAKDDSLLF